MKIQRFFTLLALMCCTTIGSINSLQAQTLLVVNSPDWQTEVVFNVGDELSFSLRRKASMLIRKATIDLMLVKDEFQHEQILDPVSRIPDYRIKKVRRKSVNDTIYPVISSYNRFIPDHYNELDVRFKGGIGLKVRVYNDGMAYRFYTSSKDSLIILDEVLDLKLSPGDHIYFPEESSFLSHSERLYQYLLIPEVQDTQFCSLPALIAKPNRMRMIITEADIESYPGMYLQGTGTLSMKAIFPHYPLEEKQIRDRTIKVEKTANYLARTKGPREFPWRVFGIAEKDADLIGGELIYRLGPKRDLEETSWIQPGLVAWDWWNDNNIYDVDFEAGINTETYKHYIDFAAENGIPYVIFDEGWSDPSDLFNIHPEMDMDELFGYAEKKNVGIILWVVWCTLDNQLNEALNQFEQWGAKGIKVDFMQRDDQPVVEYYHKIAKAAAEHKLLVDFHGSYKPDGLRRAYPNVMTREGVRGLEWCKWSEDITPDHCLTIPFIRMYAGPMDFTPGAMINAAKGDFNAVFSVPMSQGTRCQQMAMYVCYESPLQMLADCPTHYREQQECLDFLTKVPTTWDETVVIEAKVGDYLLIARRKGDTWYIGGMTDWTPREFEIDLSFLDPGEYTIELFSDGPNADRNGNDYRKEITKISPDQPLQFRMAPGGGFVGIFIPTPTSPY